MRDQIIHSRMPGSHIPTYDRRVALVQFFSAILGVEKRYYVYLPPEYAAGRDRFPVLYLLRGHEREWVNPAEDDTRAGRTVIDVYEQLRAARRIGPLILVMPSMASDDNRISGLMVDFRAPGLAGSTPGIGTGRFESYFVRELIPRIDRDYRTLLARRAVAGFSLGGAMAVKVAARYPEMFVSVSAYDGTFLFTSDGGRAVRPSDSLLFSPMFDPNFGVPRDLAYITANNPVNLVACADPAQLRHITWCIQYGPEEIEPWGSNFYRGEHLLRLLHCQGIANSVSPVIPDGQHNWATVHRHIEQVLPIHSAVLCSSVNDTGD